MICFQANVLVSQHEEELETQKQDCVSSTHCTIYSGI